MYPSIRSSSRSADQDVARATPSPGLRQRTPCLHRLPPPPIDTDKPGIECEGIGRPSRQPSTVGPGLAPAGFAALGICFSMCLPGRMCTLSDSHTVDYTPHRHERPHGLPSEFELDSRHRAECVTVCSANGRPYLIDFSHPPDLTNPPVDQNGSCEAILAPKLNRQPGTADLRPGVAPFDETPGLADFSNLGKVINDPQLVLIHPATAPSTSTTGNRSAAFICLAHHP